MESSRTRFKVLGFKASSLKNCPVLGLRTAFFFELVKVCRSAENFFSKFFFQIFFLHCLKHFLQTFFFFEIARKNFLKIFFFWRALAPVSLVLASRVSVFEKAVLGLRFFLCPWPLTLCPQLHLCCNNYSAGHITKFMVCNVPAVSGSDYAVFKVH